MVIEIKKTHQPREEITSHEGGLLPCSSANELSLWYRFRVRIPEYVISALLLPDDGVISSHGSWSKDRFSGLARLIAFLRVKSFWRSLVAYIQDIAIVSCEVSQKRKCFLLWLSGEMGSNVEFGSV